MHPEFANWYQPVTFGHNRETINLRWDGVESASENIDVDTIFDLIRLVFGHKIVNNESILGFRHYFSDIDATFKSAGNEEEVLVLAGCVLAVLCEEKHLPTIYSILNTHACGTRNIQIEIDLVNIATRYLHEIGIEERSRNDSSFLDPFSIPKKIISEIDVFIEDPDPPHAANMMLNIVPHYKLLLSYQSKINNAFNKMRRILRIQDEELQLLWWSISSWSTMWGLSFNKLKKNERPILLAKEAATISSLDAEPPSLRALLIRTGINEEHKATIPTAVTSCGITKLGQIVNNEAVCPIIFPIHFAMSRALEANAKQSWIAGWSDASAIPKTASLSLIDIAQQIYREHKLLSFNN